MSVPLPAALPAPNPSAGYTLTDQDVVAIARMMYEYTGVCLRGDRKSFLISRLSRRLRLYGFTDFREYIDCILSDVTGQEFVGMVDALTTNRTEFFREATHFACLRNEILPHMSTDRPRMRIWSAGCASGEEPYSIAMVCRQAELEGVAPTVEILGTDVSRKSIDHAVAGRYERESIEAIPLDLRERWWRRVDADAESFEAEASLRAMISFRELNLMEAWPMSGQFDMIWCRNVMIYFDKLTQQELVNRFWAMLHPGGYLFVGHSESLSGLEHRFRYIQPAVYRR